MRRLIPVLILATAMAALIAIPTFACPPAASYSTYCAPAQTYVAPAQTYYQTQTILAYPLTLLAVPAVTVQTQPAVPASVPVAPAPAPVPQQQEVQQPQQQVQQQQVQTLAAPTIVQRQVYATYAAPVVTAPSCAYGGASFGTHVGYGAAFAASRAVIVHAPVLVERAQRQRVGFFARHRAARAQRLTNRGARIGVSAGIGVPAAQLRR